MAGRVEEQRLFSIFSLIKSLFSVKVQCFPHQFERIAMSDCLKSYRLIVLYVSVEKLMLYAKMDESAQIAR